MGKFDGLVSLAAREVGVREVGGNNKGPRVREYLKATWLDDRYIDSGPPWCAGFTCWLLREWLRTPEGVARFNELHAAVAQPKPEHWRCRDASAFGWIKWAEKQGLTVFDENHATLKPQAGDFMVFDFSHIAIVESGEILQTPKGAAIRTIEGNTNGKGERDSLTGDGVWRKVRPLSLTLRFIRLERPA